MSFLEGIIKDTDNKGHLESSSKGTCVVFLGDSYRSLDLDLNYYPQLRHMQYQIGKSWR